MRVWVQCAATLAATGVAGGGCSADEPLREAAARREALLVTIDASVPAGNEEYVCRYFVVPDGGFDVAGFEQKLDPRSHHLLVFATSLAPSDVADDLDRPIRNCESDVKSHAAIEGMLYGAQPGEVKLRYPEGVALELRANEVVLVQHHIVNDSSTEISAHAELTLVGALEPVVRRAGLFHFYDWAIDVPPLERATSRMRCAIGEPLELVFLHGHMHARGRAFRSWVRRGSELVPLFESSTWNAATEQLEPPFPLQLGDAVEFECEYQNPGSVPVRQGLSARDDEMCSLTAAYVTEHGTRLDPLSEACGLDHSGVVGQGTLGCEGIEACIAGATDSTSELVEAARASQSCWLQGCPERSIAFRDLALCRLASCVAECGLRADTAGFVAAPSDWAACDACIEASCSEPRARCRAPGCGL